MIICDVCRGVGRVTIRNDFYAIKKDICPRCSGIGYLPPEDGDKNYLPGTQIELVEMVYLPAEDVYSVYVRFGRWQMRFWLNPDLVEHGSIKDLSEFRDFVIQTMRDKWHKLDEEDGR